MLTDPTIMNADLLALPGSPFGARARAAAVAALKVAADFESKRADEVGVRSPPVSTSGAFSTSSNGISSSLAVTPKGARFD
jgi:hypothetical protein